MTTPADYPAGLETNNISREPAATTRKIPKLPEDVQPEVRALIAQIQAYKRATTWEQIDEATRELDADAVYDSQLMYITGGRDRVRAVAKLLAPFAYTEFEPKLVRILMNTPERKAELELDGTLRVVPRRYWWAPVTWLLPSSVPLEGTITLQVKSWNDKVARVQERFYNVPTLIPVALRWLAGLAAGITGTLAEPVLSQLYDWFSTGYEHVAASDVVRGTADTAGGVVEGAKARVAGAAQAVGAKLQETAPGLSSSVQQGLTAVQQRTGMAVGA